MKSKKTTKQFQLWHLRRDVPGNAVLLFMSYSWLRNLGQRVDISRYYRVYTGETDKMTTLEDIFRQFNVAHPADYLARSLSVSDLIVMDGRVWYVDCFGFRDVTDEVGGVPDEQI